MSSTRSHVGDCDENVIDTLLSTRRLGPGEPECPGGTLPAGYTTDGWRNWKDCRSRTLKTSFQTMITGLLMELACNNCIIMTASTSAHRLTHPCCLWCCDVNMCVLSVQRSFFCFCSRAECRFLPPLLFHITTCHPTSCLCYVCMVGEGGGPIL